MGQERLLAVFEAVALRQPAALATVTAETSMPTSSVHRALNVLMSSGWVRTMGPGRPRWVVTEHVRTLVGGPGPELVALSGPLLTDLARAADESAALWLADGDAVVVAATAAPSAPLRVVIDVGGRTPLHACAAGKAVLSSRSDVDVRLGAARGLAPVTVRTVGDTEQLLVDLRRVRSTGIATARGEEADGVTSLAAAVGSAAAIGLVGPAERIDSRGEELAASVADAATTLNALLAAHFDLSVSPIVATHR